ncbi:GFA family protein [Aureimonas flava]|uniref:GFA family protein n=1 Tax=Aureimonas flava TaxID=2320271 RepID=A0A3A1WNA9_9HYPH|nr:GFA family protein [Aureimonas flava]RIY01353.1 GFA family protein [Aureimonas flava]
MTLNHRPAHTGGCQCGAVRFRVHGALGRASVCHCRMCQKAFGSLYAPLVNLGTAELVWTRREPRRFRSSNHVLRGFCPDCGTPLTYEAPDGVALAIGAFDDPAPLAPEIQFGIESKLPYVDAVPGLPVRTMQEDEADNAFLADLVSFQHPDREMPGEGPDEGRRP